MTATGVTGDPDDRATDAHAEDLASLHVSESTYPLMMVPMPAGQGDLPALADRLTADAVEKIDAGAQLVYALYHAGKDFWTRQHSQALLKAYMRAQTAYGVGRAGQKQKEG